MHAALTDALFWLGLGIILPAGYAVAYPAMYWAMKREQKREECFSFSFCQPSFRSFDNKVKAMDNKIFSSRM